MERNPRMPAVSRSTAVFMFGSLLAVVAIRLFELGPAPYGPAAASLLRALGPVSAVARVRLRLPVKRSLYWPSHDFRSPGPVVRWSASLTSNRAPAPAPSPSTWPCRWRRRGGRASRTVGFADRGRFACLLREL